MIRGIALVLFAVIIAAGLTILWPIRVHAAECDTFDAIRKQMVKEGHEVTMLTQAEVAVFAKRYSVAEPGRGFTVIRDGKTVLGIEVGKCITAPIDITGAPLQLSGRTRFGTFA